MSNDNNTWDVLVFLLEGWKGTALMIAALVLVNILPCSGCTADQWNVRFMMLWMIPGLAVLAASLLYCKGKSFSAKLFFLHIIPFIFNALFLILGMSVNSAF